MIHLGSSFLYDSKKYTNRYDAFIIQQIISKVNVLFHFYDDTNQNDVTANQTSGQKNEPRSTSAQIPYSVHHNELQ